MAYKHFNSKKYGTISVSYVRKSKNYHFSVGEIITEEEARIIQAHCGYAPEGYSFHSFSNVGGTSWQCWDNCD